MWTMEYMKLCILLLFVKSILSENNNTVIIVGGGPAGFAAAHRLLKNGFQNVAILEAENRFGGRIYSVKIKEAFIDLGAELCVGKENNVVYDIAKNYNILIPFDFEFRMYHSRYKLLKEDFREKILALLNDLYSEGKQSNSSLGQNILNMYNDVVTKYFDNDYDSKLASDAINFIENWTMAMHGVFSWFDVSTESEYKHNEGDQFLSWNGHGYKTILDIFMKQQPNLKKKILLNKEVTHIDWNNGKSVTVKCNDNSVFEANHVIVTIPLGVLKLKHETIFYPSLPDYKKEAIEDLGVAAISKIYMYFPQKWWASNVTDFFFIWSKEDIQNSYQEFSEGPHKDGVSWITNIVGIYAVPNNPDVLLLWIVGQHVPELELCPDDVLIKGLMHTLNKFLGCEYNNITEPNEIIRNNWYNNPHFHGVVSFETIQSRQNRVAQDWKMSKPLLVDNKPTLLFAGEATNPYHYATVHGAIETGFREADRLIEFYNGIK